MLNSSIKQRRRRTACALTSPFNETLSSCTRSLLPARRCRYERCLKKRTFVEVKVRGRLWLDRLSNGSPLWSNGHPRRRTSIRQKVCGAWLIISSKKSLSIRLKSWRKNCKYLEFDGGKFVSFSHSFYALSFTISDKGQRQSLNKILNTDWFDSKLLEHFFQTCTCIKASFFTDSNLSYYSNRPKYTIDITEYLNKISFESAWFVMLK